MTITITITTTIITIIITTINPRRTRAVRSTQAAASETPSGAKPTLYKYININK